MWGTLRWTRADLRAHSGQSILTVAVVAGVVAALVLATMLLEGALNPWQELFTQTNGADMLITFDHGTSAQVLHTLPGVREVAAAYDAAPMMLVQGAQRPPVELCGMEPAPPAMSAPWLATGSWLRADAPEGVVVEASFAAATGLAVGDHIVLAGMHRTQVNIQVIGTAYTADQGFYPQWSPGLIWAGQSLLSQVERIPGETTTEVVGLRLSNASVAGMVQVSQEVSNAYNGPGESSPIEQITTSQQVMVSMGSNERLLGLLLALFGIIGIITMVAAPSAIANVTFGRVLMQRQDIAMLKALGFTPGQVVRMLIAEQTTLGVTGTVLGLAIARVATSPEVVRPAAGIPVTLAPLPGSWVVLIAAGTIVAVGIATAIPAWRAGKVSPVAAVQPSPPTGRLSPVARLSLLVRLPAALVLGMRDALTRRLTAALTVAGAAIPMTMITMALACWSTIGAFTSNPGRIGLASALTVYPGELSAKQTIALIKGTGQVRAYYPGAQFDNTPLPGDDGTFLARAMGTSKAPYPFQAVQGRMFSAPNEAVAGQGFLDLIHERIGSWVSVTVDGAQRIFHIVGRTIEPDDDGDVLDFGLDALPTASVPTSYSLVLRPGVSAPAARARLLSMSHNQLDVQVTANPADRLGVVRAAIVVTVAVLAMIAMANLLTATSVALRDHVHEAGILKAMGLTPRQAMASLVVSTTIVTAIGVVAGTAAGLVVAPRLINAQGQASGVGWGIAVGPSPTMIVSLLCAALAVTVAAALFLARRATHAKDPLLAFRAP